jgi:hypothetical protein
MIRIAVVVTAIDIRAPGMAKTQGWKQAKAEKIDQIKQAVFSHNRLVSIVH